MVLLLLAVLLSACTNPQESNYNGTTRNESAKPATGVTEAKDSEGNTPLINEVNKGNSEEVRRLIDSGAQVNAASNTGVTPLMNAAGMGNLEIVRMLIEKGADVNAKTPSGYSVLMSASLNGQAEIARVLLDAGADPKLKDVGGRTAADFAAEHKHTDIVDMLNQKK
jgi:ankyrin repeat protein